MCMFKPAYYSVTIVFPDVEDDTFTSVFTSNDLANDYIDKVEEKLKKYGMEDEVRVILDNGTVNSEEYLEWIDDFYGDSEDE